MTEVVVKFMGKDSGLSQTFRMARGEADKTGKTVGAFGAQSKRVAFVSGTALIGLGGAAIKFGKDSIAAYRDSLKGQTDLSEAFRKFPALSDTNQAALQRLNSALQMKTKFDDDAIASGQAVLAGFKLTGSQVAHVTPLLLDYAQRTGQDLPTAAATLGKSFLGNTRALKALGINYKSTGDQTKDFNNIAALLQQKVGGLAVAQEKAAGGTNVLKNQFGELEEKAGSKLVPTMNKAVGVGLKVVDWMNRNQGTALALGGAVVGLTAFVFAMSVATKVATAAQTAWSIATKVGTAVTIVYRNAQMALNLALTANPIGLVIAAIALLVVGLVIAYKKSETFRNVVKTAFSGVAAAARWMWNTVLQPVIHFILTGFAKIASAIGTMLSALGHIPGFGWAATAGRLMLGAAAGAQRLADKIRKIPDKHVSITVSVHAMTGRITVGGKRVNIGQFARGTPAAPPGIGLVGEEGPELVDFKGGERIYTARQTAPMLGRGGRGGGVVQHVTVYLTGAVLDPIGAAQQIRELLGTLSRSEGVPITFGRASAGRVATFGRVT